MFINTTDNMYCILHKYIILFNIDTKTKRKNTKKELSSRLSDDVLILETKINDTTDLVFLLKY